MEGLVDRGGLNPKIYQQKLRGARGTCARHFASGAVDEVFSSEIGRLDADSREVLSRVLDYMARKCIGIPMSAATRAVSWNDAESGQKKPSAAAS